MKRLILVLPLAALTCVFVLFINAEKASPFSLKVVTQTQEKKLEEGVKYEDCIQKESLTTFKTFLKRENRLVVGEDVMQIDNQIQKYQASLDSTIQNLSSIDAHSFLHNEFKRCKAVILSSDVSNLQTYYHLKIMEACYEKDKELNESSQNSLAKL